MTTLPIRTGNRQPLLILTDSELADLCKQQLPAQTDAFTGLVQRYKDKVLNLCYAQLKNREDAEDAAQEVFIRIYRGIAGYRGDAKLQTWITSIARNVCLSLLLSNKHRFWRYTLSADDELNIDNIRTYLFTPKQEEDFWIRIGQTLRRMRENYRKAFILKFFKHLTIVRMSNLFQTTIGGMKMIVMRARKQFTRIYSKLNIVRD